VSFGDDGNCCGAGDGDDGDCGMPNDGCCACACCAFGYDENVCSAVFCAYVVEISCTVYCY